MARIPCEVCLDFRGTGEVDYAEFLLFELAEEGTRHTPVCRSHYGAARRYRLTRGIPLDQPLHYVEPRRPDHAMLEIKMRMLEVFQRSRITLDEKGLQMIEDLRMDVIRRAN